MSKVSSCRNGNMWGAGDGGISENIKISSQVNIFFNK